MGKDNEADRLNNLLKFILQLMAALILEPSSPSYILVFFLLMFLSYPTALHNVSPEFNRHPIYTAYSTTLFHKWSVK